jgi:hypothetical protein
MRACIWMLATHITSNSVHYSPGALAFLPAPRHSAVAKVANTGENHGYAEAVCGVDHFGVAD